MPRNVDREQLKRLVGEGAAQLVDVLPAREFGERHLPGAISIPLRKIETEAPEKLDRARPVVVYCWDGA